MGFFGKNNVPRLEENATSVPEESIPAQTNQEDVEEQQNVPTEPQKTSEIVTKTVSKISNTGDSIMQSISHGKAVSTSLSTGENFAINTNHPLLELYALIFKFGMLSKQQIHKRFPTIDEKDLKHYQLYAHKNLYLHTENSIKEFAKLSRDNSKEMRKEALFWSQIKKENKALLSTAAKEIDILLAINDACENDSNYQLYDWISTSNPRRYKKNMKIRRLDVRRGSLAPNGVITITKKSQRMCFVFSILPPFRAYLIGERRDKYAKLINAYDMWLSNAEKAALWVSKNKLYVTLEELAVILIFPTQSRDVITDLTKRMSEQNVQSSIYLTSFDDVLKKPLSCWMGNNPNSILKTKKA